MATAAQGLYVDAWQFTEAGADGIKEAANGQRPASESRAYDLAGRRLPDSGRHRGIAVEQYTDEKGLKHSRKKIWH